MIKLFSIIFIITLVSSVGFSQWQADVRLTNNSFISQTSFNYGWNIASSGDTLHLQFFDDRNGYSQIFYKRSTDQGLTWGPDTRISTSSSIAERGSIAVSGLNVHEVWQDQRNGMEIYYRHSSDAGNTWGAENRLTFDPGSSASPCVGVLGNTVHVTWSDNRDGNYEVYYKRSTDNGNTWSTDARLTNNSAESWYPIAVASGTIVHLLWTDNRDGHYEIYYKRSTDAGATWGTDTRVTATGFNSYDPTLAVNGLNVHTAFFTDRDGDYEIYYKRSTDGGLNWGSDIRTTNSAGNSYMPSLAVSGNNLHMLWEDDRDGNFEMYYKYSSNNGTSWGSDLRLTNATGGSRYGSIITSKSYVHTVWFDERDGNREIYYKRNPTGNPLNIEKISSSVPLKVALHQNYPNPFNPSTKIRFDIARNCFVELSVFDILGRKVITLVSTQLSPGTYEVNWDASSNPSGVYFCKLNAGSFSETKNVVLMK